MIETYEISNFILILPRGVAFETEIYVVLRVNITNPPGMYFSKSEQFSTPDFFHLRLLIHQCNPFETQSRINCEISLLHMRVTFHRQHQFVGFEESSALHFICFGFPIVRREGPNDIDNLKC